MFEATVYILRCANGSYYTGLTKQPIEARLWEHNEGIYEGFTKPRRPVTLVFTETYDRMLDAIARERQIKGWSRAKKEALIALDYEALPALARNRQAPDGGCDLGKTAGSDEVLEERHAKAEP